MNARALEEARRIAEERPHETLRLLDQLAAEERLIDFARFAWPFVEPARPLIEGWVLEAVAEHLEAMSRGELLRLVINIPPGTTKSMLVNVLWPAWEWGPRNNAHLRWISVSHSDDNTLRDNVRCRDVINHPDYQAAWGSRFSWKGDQNAKEFFENTKTGWRWAGSVRGGITGKRADRIIVDDPHDVGKAESDKVREEALRWFSNVLSTRVNDSRSSFVVVMQRVHTRDLSGFILAKELGYQHLCLPMRYERAHPHPTRCPSTGFVDPRTEEGELLWPERFGAEHVDQLENDLRAWGGEYAVAGQHQQRPAPREGGMFQEKDFRYVDRRPDAVISRVWGWDLAGSVHEGAKFTVGALISRDAEGRVYVEDVVRFQAGPHGVEERIRAAADRTGSGVPVSIPRDPGQAGLAQVAHFQAKLPAYDLRFSPETGSKEDRARPFSSVCESGNLFLVRGPWCDAYVAELCGFPTGEYSDQVDASSRAYALLLEHQAPLVGVAPTLIGGATGVEG